MTVENIMSFRLVKLKPSDKVCDALAIMHEQQIRNLPVVDEDDQFVGLFGIRPLVKILLPEAAKIKHGLKDLSFMSDDVGALYERLEDVANRPVSDFLQKKKKLTFCKPSTSFPEVLELLDQSSDSSLPVIVVKGKRKRLVGMVSAWDMLEKIVMNMPAVNEGCVHEEEQADAPGQRQDGSPEGPGPG
jgi:CBS domain-containing protein